MCCWELSLSLKSSKFRWSQCFSKYSDSQSARTTRSQKAGKALGVGIPQGQIQDFFWRGCTRLLLYFNTNKPHSFFLQNTSCIRKLQVISGEGGTPCTLPPDPPLHPHFLLTGNCSGSSLISSSLTCSPEFPCSFSVSCLTGWLSITPCMCNPWGRVGSATECVVREK